MIGPRLFVLHLPKTGGSSLRPVVRRQYGRGCLEFIGRIDQVIQKAQNTPPSTRDHATCVMGHYPFGLHRYFDGDFRYITMLRHPVKRVLSQYYFGKSKYHGDTVRRKFTDSQLINDIIQKMPLEDVMTYPIVSSSMTLLISGEFELYKAQSDLIRAYDGRGPLPERLSVPAEVLHRAKANLSQHFAVVGLTEYFDTSLLLYKHMLGWSNIYYETRNITKPNPQRNQLSADTLKHIEHCCALDIELYTHAVGLFEAQKAAYGLDTLTHNLAQFQARNRWASRLIGLNNRVRQSVAFQLLRRLAGKR